MRKIIRGHGLLGGALAALVTVVLAVLLAVDLLAAYFGSGSTNIAVMGITAVSAVLFLASAVGAVAALIQRWKEVQRGEEDEAKKY